MAARGLRLDDWHFWAVQLLVVGVAAVHSAVEWLLFPSSASGASHVLYFVPTALFLVPVTYAALNFGLIGAIPTAIWCTALTVPNVFFFHQGFERAGVIWQLFLVNLIAVFAGHRVDKELALRKKAESATVAFQEAGDALRIYAANLTHAQEAERRRIARDLHDETVQRLIQVCQQVDLIAGQPSAPAGLGGVRRSVEQAVDELRNFARELRPPVLDDLGVVPAIRRLLADASSRSNIAVELDVTGEPRRLTADAELALFRIAQQAVRNVEQHARASRMGVTVNFGEGGVQLEVVDDGQGFRLPADIDLAVGTHLGLLGMRERANSVGGNVQISSRPGKGTRISVVIPD